MRVLITGGAGFVGRRFCHRFLGEGAEVVCVDPIVPKTGGIDPSDGWPLFDPRDFASFRFVQEDCRPYFAAHRSEKFDYVLHLAAMVGGREMIENHPLAVADDLAIDAEFWQWARDSEPGKVVYFSSSAAYPIDLQRRDDHRLLKEDMISFESDIGMPDMTYGWAKLTGEYLARLAYERHGVQSVVYRPFSGYGEDQDLSYPFPAICRRIAREAGADEVVVWGSGDQMRDFIYIGDCVDGVLGTMDQIEDGNAVNLSTGILTSFRVLVKDIADVVGYQPSVRGMSDKPEGVFARGGCTEKQTSLGFEAQTTLREGIRRTLEYQESVAPVVTSR